MNCIPHSSALHKNFHLVFEFKISLEVYGKRTNTLC